MKVMYWLILAIFLIWVVLAFKKLRYSKSEDSSYEMEAFHKYSRYACYLLYLVYVYLVNVFLIRVPIGDMPNYIEHGVYLVFNGAVPYRDFILQHGFFFPYINGFLFYLQGSYLGIVIGYCISLIIAFELYFRWLRKEIGSKGAYIWFYFTLTFPIVFTYVLPGQNEFLMLPFICASLFYIRNRYWLSGVFLGLCYSVGSLFIIPVVLGIICCYEGWKKPILVCIAMMATILVVGIPFILQGADIIQPFSAHGVLEKTTGLTVWSVLNALKQSFPQSLPMIIELLIGITFFIFTRLLKMKRIIPIMIVMIFSIFSIFNNAFSLDKMLLIIPCFIDWLARIKRPWEKNIMYFVTIIYLIMLTIAIVGPRGALIQDDFIRTSYINVILLSIFAVAQIVVLITGFIRLSLDSKDNSVSEI